MRRAIWPALALVVAGLSFGAGRMTGFHALPEIVATLPGDEADFNHEIDTRILERFPVGTSEDKLIEYLASEQFAPNWRRRDEANSSTFVQDGLICRKIARVFWRADAGGLLTDVRGAYERHCL
jgi:hypothetical protein